MNKNLRQEQKQVQKQKLKIRFTLRRAVVALSLAAIVGWVAFSYLNLGQNENAHAGVTAKDAVKLRYFEGAVQGNKVSLRWRSLIEMESDYFVIERSADGEVFNPIGVVDATGFSTDRTDYEFVDYEPFAGECFYRLLKADLEGRIRYSNTLLVKTDATHTTRMVDANTHSISFEATTLADATIELRNVMGTVVFSHIMKPIKGLNTFYIDDKVELAAGTYFVRVVQSDAIVANGKIVSIY